MDIDVTPHDNSRTQKENVSRTYKGMGGGAMHRLSATLGKKAEAFDMNCVRVSSTVNVILFRPLTAPLIQFIKYWSNTHWNHIEPKILAIYQKDTYLLLLNKKETNIFLIF